MLRTFVSAAALVILLQSAMAAPRVALVSSVPDANTSDAIALAGTELSRGGAVELLERAQIDELMSQQTAALSGADQAVRLGELRQVEFFAVVENYGGANEAALVVFDAKSGVRLLDLPIEIKDIEVAARQISAGVRSALAKKSGASPLQLLGLAGVRNADLGSPQNERVEAVGLLLERRLTAVGGIAVLERKRLEHVSGENALPGLHDTAKLLPTIGLMEIDLSHGDKPDSLKATLFMRDAAGKQLHRIEVQAADTPQLAEALALKISQALQAGPLPAKADTSAEARRFLREAKFQKTWQLRESAIEAAHALDPKNIEILCALARSLVDQAGAPASSPANQVRLALRSADLAIEARRMAIQARAANGADQNPPEWVDSEQPLWRLVKRMSYPGEAPDPEIFVLRRQLKAKLRSLCVDLGIRAEAQIVRTMTQANNLTRTVDDILIWKPPLWETTTAFEEDLIAGFDIILKLRGNYDLETEWSYAETKVFGELVLYVINALDSNRHRESTPKLDPRRFLPLFERMKSHRDPSVASYGWIGLLAVDHATQKLDPAALAVRYGKVKTFIRGKLQQPLPPNPTDRMYVYFCALDAIGFFAETSQLGREYQELFDLMISRDEMEINTATMAIVGAGERFMHYDTYHPFGSYPKDELKQAAAALPVRQANCVKLLALIESKSMRNLNGGSLYHKPGRSIGNIVGLRERIYSINPALAPPPLPAPWTSLRAIQSFAGADAQWTFVREGILFVVDAAGTRPRRLSRLNRDGTALETIAPIPDKTYNAYPWLEHGTLHFTTVDGEEVSVATADGGVKYSPAPAVLHQYKSGDAIRVGSKVYAVPLEQPMIIVADVDTGSQRTLVSGRRSERLSPLDNQVRSFRISLLGFDPTRNRVLFSNTLTDELSGLWQIDLANDEVTQVACIPARISPHDWGDSHLLLGTWAWFGSYPAGVWTPYALIDFDPVTNLATLIAAHDARPAGPGVTVPATVIKIEGQPTKVPIVRDGALWEFEAELVILTREKSNLISFEEKLTTGAWLRMHLLSDNRAAVVSQKGIFLLELIPEAVRGPYRKPVAVTVPTKGASLELDTFELTNAQINPVPKASGGKAVEFLDDIAKVSQTLLMQPGRYEFTVYGASPAIGRAARVNIDYYFSARLRAQVQNAFAPLVQNDGAPTVFEVKAAGPVSIIINSAFKGALVDRLVIRRLE